MIFQPSMLHGMETVQVTISHVKKLEVTEMKMYIGACGHTLRDHLRNNNIRDILWVENITERYRKAIPRWVGKEEILWRIVQPGRRKTGRPTQRWVDCVIPNTIAIGTTEDETDPLSEVDLEVGTRLALALALVDHWARTSHRYAACPDSRNMLKKVFTL